jgi:hypothetical protein
MNFCKELVCSIFRERSHEFIVQAYLGGLENVNLQETGPFWNQFLEALKHYQDPKKYTSAFRTTFYFHKCKGISLLPLLSNCCR